MKIIILLCLMGLIILAASFIGLEYRKYKNKAQDQKIILSNDIRVVILADNQEETLKVWKNQNGNGYLFLPSYAKMNQCRIEYSQDCYELKQNGELIESGTALSSIKPGQTYLYEATISEEKQTQEITFVQSAQMNTMFIETESGSMEQIQSVKGNSETGEMSLYTPQGKNVYTGALEQIRGRGNNTWFNEKKPYQIKLSEKINLLDMGSAKTWILLAGAADGSAMRNKIVYEMAKELGIPFAQNTEYVDLYLNGEYAGLYLLSEKIQVNKNRVEITDLEKANEKRNPEVNWEEAEHFQSEDGRQWGIADLTNPDDITGGYLLERDNYFEEEPSAFQLASGEKFTISSPKYASQEEVEYIASVMQRIENAIFAADGKDPETGKNYKELIDFDGLVNKYLIDEVTKCDDGWRGSNYFYKESDNIDAKVYLGPVWDYDLSLGNAPEWFVGNEMPEGLIQNRLSVWYKALWEKEEFRQTVLEKYHSFFKPYMEELCSSNGDISKYEELLKSAVQMNDMRWQDKVEYTTIYPTYEEQVQFLKYFITKRIAYIDQVWDEGAIYHEVLFTGVPKLYDRTDKFEYQYVPDGECAKTPATPTKKGYRFRGWYYEGTEEIFNPSQPVWSDITVVALWEPEENVNQNVQTNGETESMNWIIAIMLLCPGLITIKITSFGNKEQKVREQIIEYGLAVLSILLLCYITLFVLGSSAITDESVQSIVYVLKYSVLAVFYAIVLGVVLRKIHKNKWSKKVK